MDPALRDSNLHGTLASMAAMFPAEGPVSTKVVGFRSFLGPSDAPKSLWNMGSLRSGCLLRS